MFSGFYLFPIWRCVMSENRSRRNERLLLCGFCLVLVIYVLVLVGWFYANAFIDKKSRERNPDFVVNYEIPLGDVIAAGNYGPVDENITDEEFPQRAHEKGTIVLESKLF